MLLFIILILIAAAFLPALVWLLFFLREDIHPEPARLIIHTILIGATATVPTLIAQIAFRSFIGPDSLVLDFLGFALIEELVKFLAAYYAINKSPFFDEPVDAMIYMIAAATGFATIENILIAFGVAQTFTLATLVETSGVLLLRFVGATLLHILSSAIVGYYWAKARVFRSYYSPLITGLVMAVLVHFTFNYLVAAFNHNQLIYSSLILIVAAFFVLNDFEILKIGIAQKQSLKKHT